MSLLALGWIFTAAVVIHNLEEALFLPAWQAQNRKFQLVNARQFRLSVSLISLVFIGIALMFTFGHESGVTLSIMSGFVIAMMINSIVPHGLLSLVTRTYMPGTATGLALVFPLGYLFISETLHNEFITSVTLVKYGIVVSISLLALVPILFTISRKVVR